MEAQEFAYHPPKTCCNRLFINTAELLDIRILNHASGLAYVVGKVGNHTSNGSPWEIPYNCFVCTFIKHMWRLGLMCKVSMCMFSAAGSQGSIPNSKS